MTAQSLSIPLDRSVFYSLYIRGLHDFLALFLNPSLAKLLYFRRLYYSSLASTSWSKIISNAAETETTMDF